MHDLRIRLLRFRWEESQEEKNYEMWQCHSQGAIGLHAGSHGQIHALQDI